MPEPALPLRRLLLELVCSGLLARGDDASLATVAGWTLLAHQGRARLRERPLAPAAATAAAAAASDAAPAAGGAVSGGVPMLTDADGPPPAVVGLVRDAVGYLIAHGFVARTGGAGGGGSAAAAAAADGPAPPPPPPVELRASQLGHACFLSSLSPEEAVFAHAELSRMTWHGLLATDDLHVLHLLTPPRVDVRVEDLHSQQEWGIICNADKYVRDVAQRAGVADALRNLGGPQAKRMAAALLLQKLLRAESLDLMSSSSERFPPRGSIQTLQVQAATYAGQVATLCAELRWDVLAGVLSGMARRVDFGVKPDLLALMPLPAMTPVLARLLKTGGITSPAELACASEDAVKELLQSGTHFSGAAGAAGTASARARDRARTLIASAVQYVAAGGAAAQGVTRGAAARAEALGVGSARAEAAATRDAAMADVLLGDF